ncbi:MAG: type II secretion system protein [Candidatus Eremiobacteraeota bacterium]|nr:type II secretion system protein [Candidatus Eremiobacteraeota bacterium]
MIRKKKGFTLVEVLVALAIIAIVLVALLRMEVSSIALAARTSLSFRALMLATREMEELSSQTLEGTYEKSYEPFSVSAKTELTSQSGFPLEVLSLEVFYEEAIYAELKSFTFKSF